MAFCDGWSGWSTLTSMICTTMALGGDFKIHLKNMRKSNWIMKPQGSGWKFRKYVSCHHYSWQFPWFFQRTCSLPPLSRTHYIRLVTTCETGNIAKGERTYMTNEFLLNTISIMKHKIQFTKLRCQFYTHHLSTIKTWEKSTPTKIHQLTGKKKAVFSGGGPLIPPISKRIQTELIFPNFRPFAVRSQLFNVQVIYSSTWSKLSPPISVCHDFKRTSSSKEIAMDFPPGSSVMKKSNISIEQSTVAGHSWKNSNPTWIKTTL